ncbi:MAG TPA: hypothetical protein VLE48_03475 [Terriglobales bacterium]|nr:hypothetical protein [Terriglobales bacterium]
MKIKELQSLLCAVLVLLSGEASLAQTTTVQLQDISAVGSPLDITGTVTMSEQINADTLTYSFEDRISARNISDKTILTMVLWVEVFYPHGQIERDVRQYECFLAPDVIAPGQVEPIAKHGGGATVVRLGAERDSVPARAEIRAMYVQFLDGSVFGLPQFGEDILRLRHETFVTLKRLDETYEHRGEDAFLNLLNEPVESAEVDNLLDNVRYTATKFGSQDAIGKVKRMLALAEERRRLIGGGGTKN